VKLFIKLTRSYDGKPLVINMDHILFLLPEAKGTNIKLTNDGNITVNETMEEIIKLIDRSIG
jgi:uncharacterized protein YlzI (FlbEa/FlbD family)